MKSNRLFGLAIVASMGVVLLAGCTSAAASSPEPHTIPSTTSRPADPTPSLPSQENVSAQDAPLSQLWALVDSSLRDSSGYAQADRQAGVLPQDFTDFASAIQTRCEPQLSSADAENLTSLGAAVTQKSQTAGTDLTPAIRAYFDVATAHCM